MTSGWVSIRGILNTDGCTFEWGTATGGDSTAYQHDGTSLVRWYRDLAFCLTGDYAAPRGACCVGEDCIPDQTEFECLSVCGVWHAGIGCDPSPCRFGACCRNFDQYCEDDVSAADCAGLHDTWFYAQTCAQVTCPPPPEPGDNCDTPLPAGFFDPGSEPFEGTVTLCGRRNDYSDTCLGNYDEGEDILFSFLVTETVCLNITATCATPADNRIGVALDDVCPPDANCIGMATSGEGTEARLSDLLLPPGPYYLMIDTWPPPGCVDLTLRIAVCPPPIGACCLPNGQCLLLTQAECDALGGFWHGPGTDCDPSPCGYWLTIQDGLPVQQGGTGYNGLWYLYPGGWWNQWWPNEFTLDGRKEITIVFDIAFTGEPPEVAFNFAAATWGDPDNPPMPEDDAFVMRLPVDPPVAAPGEYTYTTTLAFCPRWVSIDVLGDDFSIAGTIDHVCVPLGACCFADAGCEHLTAADCVADGGWWQGPGTNCDPNPCGACCLADGGCLVFTEANCLAGGGYWQGVGRSCQPNLCGACRLDTGACEMHRPDRCQELYGSYVAAGALCDPNPCGACCFDNGNCGVGTQNDCQDVGGVWQGPGTGCVPNLCPQPGACCYPDGSCVQAQQLGVCGGAGVYQGDDTTCWPNPCPQPGACCYADGTCVQAQTLGNCPFGGVYQGDDTACTPNPCPQPGACCFPDGSCVQAELLGICGPGGVYQGDNTTCIPNPCPQPVGACCYPDGDCRMTTEAACTGAWLGMGTVCDPNPCPQPGACCFPDGHCEMSTLIAPGNCAPGGTYWGDNTDCDPNPCPQPVGACCFWNCACIVATQEQCAQQGGRFKGVGTTCTLHLCVCRGDCNCDGLVNFADINPFVAALNDPQHTCCFENCDANGDGAINFADINTFVALLGGGGQCP